MADEESITWGGLTAVQASEIAQNAFLVASWIGRPQAEDDCRETPAQFCESVAQAFQALLADHAERAGHGFLADGFGRGVAGVLKEIPRGWRPAYAGTSSWLLGGRSEAEGGGEAPLQSGARID